MSAGNGRNGKAGEKAGPLVPQEHGGAIFQGTPATIVPGPGRPPSRVKAALRNDFDARRDILNEIADGVVRIRLEGACTECGHVGEAVTRDELVLAILAQSPKPADRINALKVMAQFSDLDSDRIDRGLIEELGTAVMHEIADEDVVGRIRERWVEIVARRLADV